MPISDWSSDVCSSGLQDVGHGAGPISPPGGGSSGWVHTSSSPYPPCHPDKRAPSHITQIVIPATRPHLYVIGGPRAGTHGWARRQAAQSAPDRARVTLACDRTSVV